MTSAFAGGALVLLLAGAGFGLARMREAPVSRPRLVPPRPTARRTSPAPGPSRRGPALARPRGDEADREPRPRRAPDAADRLGHRAGDDPAVLPRRRRPPHRLERDRPAAGAARARARRRARADDLARARRLAPRWPSAPPTGARRTSPRASRSPSATSPRARGNRLGVLAFGGGEPRILRPRQGRLGLLALLAELRREARATAPARPRWAPRWPAPPRSAASAGSW